MIIFNEEHKAIVNFLNRIEAKAFIKFLESERIRHEDDIKRIHELIQIVKRDIIK